ncbi:MAG: hypothetical protein GY769_15120, partial [bacterium]|nr:hypothetical protein [bacterium]
NTATLTCTGATGVVSDSDTATLTCQEPALEVTKECTADRDDEGNFIYTVTATNPANPDGATLDNCVLSDPTATCDPLSTTGPLAPGQSATTSCTSPNGTNTATVTCDIVDAFFPDGSPKTVSDEDSATCDDVQVDKQVSCDAGLTWNDVGFADGVIEGCIGWSRVGVWSGVGVADEIKFRYRARNTGGGALTSCVLTDSNGVVIALPTPVGDLAVGEERDIFMTSVLECNDQLLLGEPNTATLVCTGGTGQVSDDDTATVEACQEPALDVTKVCSADQDPQVNFVYTVIATNPANANGATLDNCVLFDPAATCDPLSTTGPLAPGDSATTTCTSSSLTNTASVTCDIVGAFQPIVPCDDLSLSDDTVTDTQAHSTCGTLDAGPNYAVMGPDGNLTLTAGTAVVLNNGFEVGVDGTFIAGNDAALLRKPKTISATATATCDDDEVDKKVSCDGGRTWHDVGYNDGVIEGCTGWSGDGVADEIKFLYRARNPGAGALTDCVLTDSNLVVIPVPIQVGALPIGFDGFIHQTTVLDCDEVLLGGEPNTATLVCTGATGQVSDSDTATLTCQEPAVDLVKECAADVDPETGKFVYTVTVTNTGEADLAICQVTDTTASGCDTTISSLAPGAAESIECLSPIDTNTATVTCDIVGAFFPDGSPKTVTDEDLAECEVCPPKLTFEEFQKGDIITNQYAGIGLTVTTSDPVNHPAMIFDTFNPTGGDFDLGTPNTDFGGPGIGSGGGFGQPGQNSLPLGKILILSEDNDPTDPDDDAGPGTIIFTFDHPVPLTSVGILDIDNDEEMGTVTAYDAEVGGGVIATADMQTLGNNSYQDVPLEANGVRRIEVHFPSSGAVSSIVFCPEFCVEEAINDPRVRVQAAGHAFWLPGISDDFIFEPAGDFIPFDDGTALMTGTIRNLNNLNEAFEVDVQLSGRVDPPGVPPGSPKKELLDSAYSENGGPIDTSTFSYYTGLTGILTGIDDFQGAVLQIDRTGPAFQIGKGANNKNTNYGASAWFDWVVLSQPDDTSVVLPDGQGDINVDIPCECFDTECVPMKYVDDFESGTYSGGTGMWIGPWIENDPTGSDQSATEGNVQVKEGDLRLDNFNYQNPAAGDPFAYRTLDLSGKVEAWLKFYWHLGWWVDSSDAAVVEVSTDGANFTVVKTITGHTGMADGWEWIDISDYISPYTTIRFRISNKYGGEEEFFFVDSIKILGKCVPDQCVKPHS